MSIEKITDRILSDAKNKTSQITTKAQKEAASILEQAKKTAQAEHQRLLAEGRKEAELAQRRILSAGEMESKKILLASKQKLIDDAFESAMGQLKAMDNSRFSALFMELMARTIETGSEVVLVNESTKGRLPSDFISQVQRSVANRVDSSPVLAAEEASDIGDGFVLKRGEIEINMTFDAILRQNRDRLAGEIVKILF